LPARIESFGRNTGPGGSVPGPKPRYTRHGVPPDRETMTTSRKTRRPFGILVLTIVQIFSGLQLLGGALWAFAVAAIASTSEAQELLAEAISPWMAQNAGTLFLILGIALLVLAMWSFLLARGYFKGLDPARRKGRRMAVYAIVLAVIGIILVPNRTDPGSPWWTIILNAAIYFYLGSEKVKSHFGCRK